MLKKSWKIEVPVEFLADSDSYIIEGRKYFRVTRVKSVINQPGLSYWRAKIGITKANQIMKTRGIFGTNLHKLIEVILNDGDVDSAHYDVEMQQSLNLFVGAKDKYNIQAEAIEQKLWSDKLGVAGTCDMIGYSDLPKLGRHAHIVWDWKSSKTIYEDYWLQLACYVIMFEKMTNIKLDGAAILQIRDNKMSLAEKTYDELLAYYDVFKHCIALFKYTKGDF